MALGTEIVLLAILLVLSGFFSASEVALISLSKSKVHALVEHKKRAAVSIQKLKENPQRMLSTILIGNNLVNVGATAVATALALRLFDSYAVGIATGMMTLLILVFGEITPKSIATRNNVLVSQFVAWPLWKLSIILAPVLMVLDAMLNKLMDLLGVKKPDTAITEEEIKSLVKTAEEEGSIKEIEKKLIHNIFEFDDINVAEIATPRTDMVAIEQHCTAKQAMNLILKKGLSRIPVFEKNRDHIVGIVYVKDLLGLNSVQVSKTKVTKVMKKPYFVPETKKVSNLLRQFQRRKEHMAIVVDEHGSVTGLVTLEDVLEEIVGEIMDETDKIDPNIKAINKKTWLVQGKTDIDEVNDKLKMKLKGEDYDTFSGFIFKHTGKIPNINEVITYKKFKMKIKEVNGNRIALVKVEKK